MSKFPQSCYIVGVFLGVHPEVSISADFQKQPFAIDTAEQFGNVKVCEAHHIAQLAEFKKGDIVKVSFNVRSNKTAEGKWFTNVTAWKVTRFVPQDTDDFQQPDPAFATNTATPVPPPADGDDLPF